MQNQQFCNIHGEPFIYFDQYTDQGLCRFCAQKKIDNVVSIEQMEQQHQQKIDKAVNEISNTIELLYSINDQLNKFKQSIQSSTEKVISILYEQISKMKQQKEKYVNLLNVRTKNMQSFQSEYSNQQQFNHQLKNQLQKLLQDIESRLSLENIIKQVNLIAQETQSQIQDKKQRIYVSEILQQNWFRSLEFKQVYQSQIQNMDYCRSFAINKDQNTLLVGCGKQIIVYELKNGILLNQLQVLSNHQHDVTCLCFMEKSRQFVSASKDKFIKIWSQNNNRNWQQIESIPLHNDWINALIINQKEDLIISASDDNTLKFLSLVDQKWVCSQSIDLSNQNSQIKLRQITSISLNFSQDKLIACGNDPQILILDYSEQQWKIVQMIDVKEYGYRLCFIGNNQFVFQPCKRELLEVYTQNKQKKTFRFEGSIHINQCKNCDMYFPCQFIGQKNLIAVKHGRFLNFFQIIDNREIKFEQKLEFADDIFYGTLSLNGQYLITWDSRSKQIQVRQVNYIQ